MTTNRARYDAGAPHAPATADAWAGAISDEVDILTAGDSGSYAPPGDYVESTDVTDIVVVDFGMLPGTPDANTLYFEREEV